MYVRVVIPPVPIVAPVDIAGGHADDDPKVAALIAAATEQIDGPTGWVGRCFGVQTLEMVVGGWRWDGFTLPCPPIIDIVSVKYLDTAGAEQTSANTVYRTASGRLVLQSGQSWPNATCAPDAVRIRYRAGYDGDVTGPIPERARQAIILTVQHLLSTGFENLFLSAEEVDGIGRRQYTVSDQAATLIESTSKHLLSGLRVPRV